MLLKSIVRYNLIVGVKENFKENGGSSSYTMRVYLDGEIPQLFLTFLYVFLSVSCILPK